MTERREFLKSLVAGTAIVGIPPVESIETLGLAPGDTLVLTVEGAISYENANRIKMMLEEKFPGHKALILSEGMKLKVMKADAWTT